MARNGWTWRPWDQTRAVDNARAASTELARNRVEREEVELFLERHRTRRASVHTA